jgi:death-on-curing family protein
VENIHDEVVAKDMPFDEPIDPLDHADAALLDSAVNRPFQTFDGKYLHEGFSRQAAALFHSLVCNHCFMNGNKRTAVMALDMFCTANGLCLLMSNDDVYQLAKGTAECNVNGEDTETVLSRISVQLDTFAVPFDALIADPYKDIKHIRSLYRECLKNRQDIRNHRLNCQQPADL